MLGGCCWCQRNGSDSCRCDATPRYTTSLATGTSSTTGTIRTASGTDTTCITCYWARVSPPPPQAANKTKPASVNDRKNIDFIKTPKLQHYTLYTV